MTFLKSNTKTHTAHFIYLIKYSFKKIERRVGRLEQSPNAKRQKKMHYSGEFPFERSLGSSTSLDCSLAGILMTVCSLCFHFLEQGVSTSLLHDIRVVSVANNETRQISSKSLVYRPQLESI